MNDMLGKKLSAVPLFPLPNVVLFPRGILPLHIFEERYKSMISDALNGDRQIAMALLHTGWEKNYYQRPTIEPVVCVGTILKEDRLPDGKFNLLLQGISRARVVKELDSDRVYRLASLAPLEETNVIELDLSNERQRLTWMFGDGPFSDLPVVRQFRTILASPLPTPDVADLIAFNLLDDVALKQSLLAETDVTKRVRKVIGALESLRPMLESKARRSIKQSEMN